jgi:hypothetical protein
VGEVGGGRSAHSGNGRVDDGLVPIGLTTGGGLDGGLDGAPGDSSCGCSGSSTGSGFVTRRTHGCPSRQDAIVLIPSECRQWPSVMPWRYYGFDIFLDNPSGQPDQEVLELSKVMLLFAGMPAGVSLTSGQPSQHCSKQKKRGISYLLGAPHNLEDLGKQDKQTLERLRSGRSRIKVG